MTCSVCHKEANSTGDLPYQHPDGFRHATCHKYDVKKMIADGPLSADEAKAKNICRYCRMPPLAEPGMHICDYDGEWGHWKCVPTTSYPQPKFHMASDKTHQLNSESFTRDLPGTKCIHGLTINDKCQWCEALAADHSAEMRKPTPPDSPIHDGEWMAYAAEMKRWEKAMKRWEEAELAKSASEMRKPTPGTLKGIVISDDFDKSTDVEAEHGGVTSGLTCIHDVDVNVPCGECKWTQPEDTYSLVVDGSSGDRAKEDDLARRLLAYFVAWKRCEKAKGEEQKAMEELWIKFRG